MEEDKDVDSTKVDTHEHRLLPGAPKKTRPLIGVEAVASSEVGKLKHTESNEYEEDLAYRRHVVFEKLKNKLMTREEAIAELKVKQSRFYELYRDYRQSKNYTGMIRGKRGPKLGSTHTSEMMLAVLEAAFAEKYSGPKASIMVVLRRAQELCGSRGLTRPTRHMVSKFIKSKPARLICALKYGEEEAAQKYDPRPGFKESAAEDADVQMDHTLVDIELVDERDRRCIAGRPWLTIIICTLTRVILGYFLSFRTPSVITVQLAILSAVLPKNSMYNPLSADPFIYPFSGVPPGLYTDNAAEFITQQLKRKCRRYEMDWEHRPIGKKWFGGIVERVIGTFMTGAVHFLPGTTGSNTVERKFFNSEVDATMTLPEFKAWFQCEVSKYHSKRHDAIDCSPRMAWAELRGKGTPGELKQISEEDSLSFALDFMPSEYDKKIHDYGINFASRRYWGEELAGRIGSTCEIRYDPNNLLTIWVLLDSTFVNIKCSRVRKGDSMDYESYKKSINLLRSDPARRQIPVGFHTDEYGLEAEARSQEIVAQAINNTALSKTANQGSVEEVCDVSADIVTVAKLPFLDDNSIAQNEEAEELKPRILFDDDDF